MLVTNHCDHLYVQAVDRMKQEVGEGKELKVEYLLVDLASFASVKDFVKTFKEKNLPLHILVNNAGIAWVPYSKLIYVAYLAYFCVLTSLPRVFSHNRAVVNETPMQII